MKFPLLDNFTFAYPWILFGLLALPLLAVLRGKKGGESKIVFSSLHILNHLGHWKNAYPGRWLWGLILCSLTLTLLALARPQFIREKASHTTEGISVMLAIDVSRSMASEDFRIKRKRANRLQAAKSVAKDFIKQRHNDRIGIVAFAGRPYPVSPITLDHDWVLKNLERTEIGLVEDGTAIGSAIASAASRLDKNESKSKIIVLLTDGANNVGQLDPVTAAGMAQQLGIKIYTIAIGSPGTHMVPIIDQYGMKRYQMIESFDPESLKKIAEATQGQYYNAKDLQSLKDIFSEIDQLEKTEILSQKTIDKKELYQWFLAAGLLFLLLSIILNHTILRIAP